MLPDRGMRPELHHPCAAESCVGLPVLTGEDQKTGPGRKSLEGNEEQPWLEGINHAVKTCSAVDLKAD